MNRFNILFASIVACIASGSALAGKKVSAQRVCTDSLLVKEDARIEGDLGVVGLITRLPHNNIYFLGDSYNDTGNLKILRPDLAISFNLLLPNGEAIMVRFNETGRNSDGLVRSDFFADSCGYKLFTASALKCLPEGTGNFVNFAISGASQNNNYYLFSSQEAPPALSIAYQVEQLVALLAKKGSLLTSEDVCVMQSTGNDAIILALILLGVPGNLNPVPSVDEYIAAYVDSAIANIGVLYSKGCRRLFVELFEPPLSLPLWTKLNNNFPPILPLIDVYIGLMQKKLREAIAANVESRWQDLDVTIINQTVIWDEVKNNTNQFGVRQTLGLPGCEDIVLTMTDLGWPEILARNVFFFDDVHPTEHSHKMFSGFMKNWLSRCDSQQTLTGTDMTQIHDPFKCAQV